jgi:hypothetical protein
MDADGAGYLNGKAQNCMERDGGPAVVAPTRQTYRSDVIRDLLKYEFGGGVDPVFAPDGLCSSIELPANSQTLA